MISKIIQKEKERQEEYFEIKEDLIKNCRTMARPAWIEGQILSHKQSLINLKEYLEEIMKGIKLHSFRLNIEEDIKALSEMIKKYG